MDDKKSSCERAEIYKNCDRKRFSKGLDAGFACVCFRNISLLRGRNN